MSSNSFSAARDRVLARQQAREVAAGAEAQAQQAAILSSPISGLPLPLNRAAPYLHSFWATIEGREGTNPSFRVGQVDAELLDEDLLQLLQGQVAEALKYYGPHLQDDWSQEILLLLRAVLFKLSIWDNDASYGASLQNLRYCDARRPGIAHPTLTQKSLYGFLTVLGRYGWERWQGWLVAQAGGFTTPSEFVLRVSQLTNIASTIHSVAAFVSFLVFLINGRYRTLTDRLLRLRLVPPSSQLSRQVSFEYLNRQLVWHAFTEFLLFLLPLVGIGRWRRWISRAWKSTKAIIRTGGVEEESEQRKSGPLAYLPDRTCAICYQDQNPALTSETEILGANSAAGGVIGSATTDIVNPYETLPCGCIYCFVCIATKLEAEEGSGWSCLRCGKIVYRCKPWTGDVMAGRPKSGNGTKAVEFIEEQAAPQLTEKIMQAPSEWTKVEHSND